MKMLFISEIDEEKNFAIRAAEHFSKNPKHYSYTDKEIDESSLLALRWGAAMDCVLVVKLDDAHEPANYQQLIKTITQGE